MNTIFRLPTGMQRTAEFYVAKRTNTIFGCSVKFLGNVRTRLRPVACKGSHRIWKDETILQKPGLLKDSFHSRIVSGSIDLGCGFPQPNESIFDLHVCIWGIRNGCVLQQFRKQKRVLANSLHWLRYVRGQS